MVGTKVGFMEFPKKETLNGKCFNSGWFSKGLFKTFLMSKMVGKNGLG